MSKKAQVILDLNKPIIDIKGKPHTNGDTLADVLADYLSARRGGNARKQWQWALKLGAGETITLDRVDFDELKGFVDKEDEMLRNIVKAQLLEIFAEAEKKADENSSSADDNSSTSGS